MAEDPKDRRRVLHLVIRGSLKLSTGDGRELTLRAGDIVTIASADSERALDRRLARALDRLTADPARPWTVAELAREAGLSRAAFARRFLAELGVPPLRF